MKYLCFILFFLVDEVSFIICVVDISDPPISPSPSVTLHLSSVSLIPTQDTAAASVHLTSLQRRLQDDLQPALDRLAAATAATDAKVGALDARTAAVHKAQGELQQWVGGELERRRGKGKGGATGTATGPGTTAATAAATAAAALSYQESMDLGPSSTHGISTLPGGGPGSKPDSRQGSLRGSRHGSRQASPRGSPIHEVTTMAALTRSGSYSEASLTRLSRVFGGEGAIALYGGGGGDEEEEDESEGEVEVARFDDLKVAQVRGIVSGAMRHSAL